MEEDLVVRNIEQGRGQLNRGWPVLPVDAIKAPGFEAPWKYPALRAQLSSLNYKIYRLDFSSTKMLCR